MDTHTLKNGQKQADEGNVRELKWTKNSIQMIQVNQ